MLTLIEARTLQGALLSLPLGDISSGYIVENVDGLDPVKATIASSSFASMDGAQYQNSRREARNLKFTIKFAPDYVTTNPRDLRNRIYSFFMPKSQVDLRFYLSDGLIVDILGRVETCEGTPFSQEPKVDISIICFNPDFIGHTPISLTGNTVSTVTDTAINYAGSVPAGFIFTLNLNRNISVFTIYNRLPGGVPQKLEFDAALLSGDILLICTVSGSKYVTLNRGGVFTSLLYGMDAQSDWIQFQPGTNEFRVQTDGASIPYQIAYADRHGGL